jgi:hypothetical protein
MNYILQNARNNWASRKTAIGADKTQTIKQKKWRCSGFSCLLPFFRCAGFPFFLSLLKSVSFRPSFQIGIDSQTFIATFGGGWYH